MHLRQLLPGLLACTLAFAEEIPRAVQVVEPPERVAAADRDQIISSSRQFRINGGSPDDRAAVMQLSEEAKSELLRLTEEADAWKIPVSITLHGKSGDPLPARSLATKILVSELGYGIHLDVHLSRGIDQERFKSAITSALVFERTLRGKPAEVSDTPYFVPPWLIDGLREATAWRLNQTDRKLYAALFKTGGLFAIDDLFSIRDQRFEDMDGASRTAFRVSSGALVMALLQQPQGKEGFRKFLDDVAGYQGEMPALLRTRFPELNLSETSLAKWWQLQMAQNGYQNLATDVLSVPQTESALAESLRLNFRTPEGILQQKDLSAWPEVAVLPEPDRISAVRLAQDSLVRLSYRCFPSYRPLIAEYQLVLNAIAKNSTEKVAAQLSSLDERRATMTAKALHAKDYMDWFEITRARETSGEFDDYIRLKERLANHPHRREDNLSKYLDRMDELFSRGLDPKAGPTATTADLQDLPPLPPLPGH